MKKIFKISAFLAAFFCALVCFCGCSTYSAVLKAFEAEGYSESDSVQSYQEQFKSYIYGTDEDGNEDRSDVTIHVLYKGDSLLKAVVVIAEFTSSKALEERYAESTDLQNLVSDLQNSDYVNGNCVLLLNLTSDGLTIFKNA